MRSPGWYRTAIRRGCFQLHPDDAAPFSVAQNPAVRLPLLRFAGMFFFLFYFAFMLPPKPVNVNINFLTSLTLTDKINIYHSSFGEKMTVPHATKRIAFRFFWLPDFFDCSRIHPLSEFFLKLRSNTHFEKTLFDARRLRCLFLQHTACCLEFVFFLCPFVIADRKSQYRNTGQFASFSPSPQFLPCVVRSFGSGCFEESL